MGRLMGVVAGSMAGGVVIVLNINQAQALCGRPNGGSLPPGAEGRAPGAVRLDGHALVFGARSRLLTGDGAHGAALDSAVADPDHGRTPGHVAERLVATWHT